MRKRQGVQTAVAVPAKLKVEKNKTPAKKPRIHPSGHVLPEPVPFGEILTDVGKKKWQIGKSVGIGGFGEIYLASEDITKPVSTDECYVIKIEPHNNGPLFTEMHFYHRAAKSEMIEQWKTDKKLKFLGMPKFVAFGSHELRGAKYRFLVMERFGDDLQKFLANKAFSLKTVLTVGIKILDILEYIHSTGYIHADIKASNLLLGFGKENEVYLVDFGLACRYLSKDKSHKPYEEDPRKAHDGTIEFTSRDAHVGVHSRRGDLEILGYNMLQWLCGKLPWEDKLKDPLYVKEQKNMFMDNIPKLLAACFKGEKHPEAIEVYLKYVSKLKFGQEPDYEYCRKAFISGLVKVKLTNDGKLDLKIKASPNKRKAKPSQKKVDNENEDDSEVLVKKPRSGIRRPCGLAQTNRLKRSPKVKSKSQDVLQSKIPVPIGDIPTPAMIHVMQLRAENLKQQKLAKKNELQASCSSNESSPIDRPSRSRRPGLRQPQVRRGQSSSSVSSRDDHKNSLTPPLF